ncbi:MAG: family 43 glycosylhydrolase, partial [archaeon]
MKKIMLITVILLMFFLLTNFVFSISYQIPVDYVSKQITFAADPVILQDNGFFYMYATGGNNIPIYKSKNLINWTYIGNAFAQDNINTVGKKQWENINVNANYKYYYLWAPGIIKLNGKYILTFSATQATSQPTAGQNEHTEQTIWLAWADSPQGPFGPDNLKNIRMHEPVPIRNYAWGFTANLPHSELNSHIIGDPNNPVKMRIDSSFFNDNGEIWLLYTWYDNGNQNSIVKLNNQDPSLTNTSKEFFRLTNSSNLSLGETRLGQNNEISVGITEGPEIIKRNNKYYLFYSVNSFNSNAYSIRYKMANNLSCLEYGKENNSSCGVKEGIAYDGFNSNYTYGHSYPFYGPNNEKIFHIITVMSDSDKVNRTVWLVEQEFNSDGTPKYSTPQPTNFITLNLSNTDLDQCTNQNCDNIGVDGIIDYGKTCSNTFETWYQKDSYKNMVFDNTWAYIDDEWVNNLGNNWYWFQGNCELGTYPRSISINKTTGLAWGQFDCNQTGIDYCDSVVQLCTDDDWTYNDTTCQSNNTATRTWSKIGTCTGGINHDPLTEPTTCTYQAPTCTSFTYNPWTPEICPQSGTQTTTTLTKTPTGCQGGNPILSKSCTYTPTCTSTDWTYNDTTCQSNNTATRTWSKIGTCTGGINHDPLTEPT